MELVDLLKGDLQRPTRRSHALPVDTQVIAALQFYASGSFQWMCGRSSGMSQPAMSVVIEDVTNALCKLAPTSLSFPTDNPTMLANKLAFNGVAGMPNVIGCIDGTHIAIKSPSQNEDAYVNRKGFHSINVQAVCDNNMKLLNLVAKWPGSSHDSFIWRSSSLHRMFENGFIQGGWLLGRLQNSCIYIE
jgi:hypothetical protein